MELLGLGDRFLELGGGEGKHAYTLAFWGSVLAFPVFLAYVGVLVFLAFVGVLEFLTFLFPSFVGFLVFLAFVGFLCFLRFGGSLVYLGMYQTVYNCFFLAMGIMFSDNH